MLHSIFPQYLDRQLDGMLAREEGMRRRLHAAATRAANDAEGPGRYLVRTRGVAARRREGLTAEEERAEATRWWIQQAQHLGILSGAHERARPPRMEYVLRTRTFNAEKERARREELRRVKSAESLLSKADTVLTPDTAVMSSTDGEDEQSSPVEPNELETTATSSTDGEDEQSSPVGQSELDEESAPKDTCSEYAAMSLTDDGEEEHSPPVDQSKPDGTCSPAPQNIRSDDEDTFECTICLAEVEDGERVGVLPCTHVFHVDCLRQWIARKNACPLCQVTEIATARPAVDAHERDGGDAGDDDRVVGPSSLEDVTADAGAGGDAPSAVNGAGSPRRDRWFAPSFLFPSDEPGSPASGSRTSRLSLSPSSIGRGSPVSGRSGDRQQRRRRRERRSEDLFFLPEP